MQHLLLDQKKENMYVRPLIIHRYRDIPINNINLISRFLFFKCNHSNNDKEKTYIEKGCVLCLHDGCRWLFATS